MKKATQTKKTILVTVILLIVAAIATAVVVYYPKISSPKESEVQSKQGKQPKRVEDKKAQQVEEQPSQIKIYFAEPQGEYLVSEVRTIPGGTNTAEAVVQELIKGPSEANHVATIPQGTKLLKLEVADGLAYVDFSQEFKQNHPGGSAGETMTIYSVVNSLTELPNINKVKFLIEGQEVETLAGHADLTQPLARNKDIIRK